MKSQKRELNLIPQMQVFTRIRKRNSTSAPVFQLEGPEGPIGIVY